MIIFKKLFLIIIINISVFIGIYNVSAACYEIRDVHSLQVIKYTTNTKSFQDTSKYKVEKVGASKCKTTKKSSSSSKSSSKSSSTSNNDSLKNYDDGNVVSCGSGLLTDIPSMIPRVVHIIYLFIQIAIPVLLVIFGSIDFLKAVIAQKEDEIKKGQQTFIKRLIAGILVFFVFSFVKIIISFAADSKSEGRKIINCASCLINNNSKCVKGA